MQVQQRLDTSSYRAQTVKRFGLIIQWIESTKVFTRWSLKSLWKFVGGEAPLQRALLRQLQEVLLKLQRTLKIIIKVRERKVWREVGMQRKSRDHDLLMIEPGIIGAGPIHRIRIAIDMMIDAGERIVGIRRRDPLPTDHYRDRIVIGRDRGVGIIAEDRHMIAHTAHDQEVRIVAEDPIHHIAIDLLTIETRERGVEIIRKGPVPIELDRGAGIVAEDRHPIILIDRDRYLIEAGAIGEDPIHRLRIEIDRDPDLVAIETRKKDADAIKKDLILRIVIARDLVIIETREREAEIRRKGRIDRDRVMVEAREARGRDHDLL